MGLPVWRAPSPVESKDAIKVHLNAPSRSPIRRRVRSPVRPRHHARRSPNAHAPISGTSHARSSHATDGFLAAATNFMYNADASRPPSRPRVAPPPVPEPRNYAREAEYDRQLVQAAFRDDVEPRSYDSRRVRTMREQLNARYPPPSFPRDPRVFGEVDRELPAYTPNFAPAEQARYRDNPVDGFVDGLEETNAARLRAARQSSRPRSRDMERVPLLPSRSEIAIIEDLEDESSDDNTAVFGFPPLRRMGRRTIADGPLPSSSLRESWSPATTVDGLGDRDRSLSPVDGHWETMLSTVAPDPIPPTAESSFTSAAASASFSNSNPSTRSASSLSNSASSTHTHLTVPSRHDSFSRSLNQMCDTSDEDSASDTEPEPEDMEVHVLSSHPGPFPSRHTSSLGADEPPSRNPFRYSRVLRDRSREASRFVRNYYSFSSSRAGSREERERSRSVAEDRERDLWRSATTRARDVAWGNDISRSRSIETMEDDLAELEQMRSVLERLARRDDIPEEFWISAGLAPPLAERVDRLQREREPERRSG